MSFDARAADLLFQVVTRRYEKRSVVLYVMWNTSEANYSHITLILWTTTERREGVFHRITTNLPFSDWPTIFPNAGSAIALIDRLVHHAEILTIDGDSYRRRVAEAKRKPSRSSES